MKVTEPHLTFSQLFYMYLGYTKKDLKFFKALQFWEYRSIVLEYHSLRNYALTIRYSDGRAIILGLMLPDLENESELRQFSDWIFVMCHKYKKMFREIKISENPENKKKEFIDLYIEV